MKLIFTLALAAIAHSVLAQPNSGKITITNLSAQELFIELDGKQISNPNTGRMYVLTQLTPGNHMLRIYSVERARRNAANNIFQVKKVLQLQRNVNTSRKNHADVLINRFGKIFYDEMLMTDPHYVQNDMDDRYENDPRANNGNTNGGYNNGYNNGGHNNGGYDPRYDKNAPRPMSEQTFASLMDALTKERFDQNRVSMARQVIDQNYFTADQVKQILKTFSFDNYKLDLAKLAYRNTVNRNEYFVIYEVFSFTSSKDDLANYIKAYK